MSRSLVVLALSFIFVAAALADGSIPGPSALAIETTSLSTPAALSPNGDGAFDTVAATAIFAVRHIAGLNGVGPEGSERLEHRYVIKFSLTGLGLGGTATVTGEVEIAAADVAPGQDLEVPAEVPWGGLTSSGSLPDGTYALSLHAELQRIDTIVFAKKPPQVIVHELGQAEASVGTVRVRTRCPVITLLAPTATIQPSRTVHVSGQVDDPDVREVTVNGTLKAPVTALAFSLPVVYPADGPAVLTVDAVVLGLAAQQVRRDLIIDTEPPVISSIAPPAGTWTTGAIEVSCAVADVTNVNVTIGGVVATRVADRWQALLNLTTEGAVSVEISAVDEVSLSRSTSVEYRVDRTPPRLTLNNVPPYTNQPVLQLGGTVFDLNLQGVTVGGMPAELQGEVFAGSVALAGADPVSVPVVATDLAGNSTQVLAQTCPDFVPPVLSVAEPVDGRWTNASQVKVAGTAVDLHLAGVTVNGQPASLSGLAFEAIVPLVADGDHALLVAASDLAGNLATPLTVTARRDTTAPTLTLSPSDGAVVTSPSPLLRVTFGDAASGPASSTLAVQLDGAPITQLFAIAGGTATYQIPGSTPLANGSHSFLATMADLAGNSASVHATFTIAAQPDDGLAPQILALSAGARAFNPAPNPYDSPDKAQLPIAITISKMAAVTILAYSERGALVATTTTAFLPKGDNQISWRGRMDDGRMLRPGDYRLEVHATDLSSRASLDCQLFVHIFF